MAGRTVMMNRHPACREVKKGTICVLRIRGRIVEIPGRHDERIVAKGGPSF